MKNDLISPDQNAMGNLWWLMDINKNSKQFENQWELKAGIQKSWGNLSDDQVKNLISSMFNRVYELL